MVEQVVGTSQLRWLRLGRSLLRLPELRCLPHTENPSSDRASTSTTAKSSRSSEGRFQRPTQARYVPISSPGAFTPRPDRTRPYLQDTLTATVILLLITHTSTSSTALRVGTSSSLEQGTMPRRGKLCEHGKVRPGASCADGQLTTSLPGHLQVGGGVTDKNCREWIEAGASKVLRAPLQSGSWLTLVPLGYRNLVSVPRCQILSRTASMYLLPREQG